MRIVFFVLLIAAFAGCEENPSTLQDLTGTAPVIRSTAVSPTAFDLDGLTPSGTSYRLSTTVAATVADPQGIADIREVRWNLYAPAGTSPLSGGTLVPSVPGPGAQTREYTGVIAFDATRTSTGAYRLEIVATDAAGFRSTIISSSLTVRTGGSAPALSLAGARQVAAAGADSALFALTVYAADPNGLADVAGVTVRALASRDSSEQTLHDDGSRAHGDAIAGDGIFSGYRWVRPLTVIPAIVFEYRATDRSGHASNVLRRSANNERPVFTRLDVPSTITRPVSGSSVVSFFAAVSDPNGRTDIDSVYFMNLSSTQPSVVLMYDDGDLATHGDSVAADGTWSRRLSIDAATSTGAKTFRFSATDRAGARADSTRIITIN